MNQLYGIGASIHDRCGIDAPSKKNCGIDADLHSSVAICGLLLLLSPYTATRSVQTNGVQSTMHTCGRIDHEPCMIINDQCDT